MNVRSMRGRGAGGFYRAGIGLVLGAFLAGCRALQRFEFEEPHMGTLFRVVAYARDPEQAERAARAAFERIAELDRRLSDYRPTSEVSRLAEASENGVPTAFLPISRDLWTVLLTARIVSIESGGAFDVTVGPLVRLWRRARRQGRWPDPAELEEARGRVGEAFLELAPDRPAVRLHRRGLRLDLGGIAKGYALDEALAVLARHGIRRALIDGGGDIAAGAPPPGRAGWRVLLPAVGSDPPPALELRDAAVATSGPSARGFELDGVRVSHLIDPRSGLALRSPPLVSVLAPRGILADAWASALCVLGPSRGFRLASSLAHVEARFVWGKPPRESATRGLAARLSSEPLPSVDPKPPPEP